MAESVGAALVAWSLFGLLAGLLMLWLLSPRDE